MRCMEGKSDTWPDCTGENPLGHMGENILEFCLVWGFGLVYLLIVKNIPPKVVKRNQCGKKAIESRIKQKRQDNQRMVQLWEVGRKMRSSVFVIFKLTQSQ